MGGKTHRLAIVGDVGVDLVMGPISDWPQIGTEIVMEQSELRAGGSAGNAVLAAAWLGEGAHLVSAVGNDDMGAWLRNQFGSAGTALAVSQAPTTFTAGVIHANGERTFFTTRGHLEHLTYELVRARLAPAPAPGSIALLSGVFLTPVLRASYLRLIADLGALGYQVALDTNWPPEGWSPALRAEVGGWIARCDHVLLNDLEVRSLAGVEDLDEALERVQGMLKPGAALVVKNGARGAIGAAKGERCECAAARTTVFDSVGAGDSFNVGYLVARLNGAGLAAAVSAGCETAAEIISRFPRRGLRRAPAPALERA
jgi:ribokinase